MSEFAFSDLVDDGKPIRVLARIAMLRTEDGGRKSSAVGAYRPNHNFGAADGRTFYVGQVEIPAGTSIAPGETRDLLVTFISGEGLSDLLQVGRTWRIQEGQHLIANAHVLSREGEA